MNDRLLPKAMQLTAGRCAQGAYWEDWYHATAVETGEHLLRCIVYIDLNMVRAGVVSHPSDWTFVDTMKSKLRVVNAY